MTDSLVSQHSNSCAVLMLHVHIFFCQLDRSKCEVWLKDLRCGLSDIFSSKLDPGRRGSALCLSAVLAQMFGVDWAVQSEPTFLMLWLRLAVVVGV